MANKTKIEWTESSWNPITGCTKISAGCQNCYAAAFAKRLKAMHNPRYINEFEVTIHEDLIDAPLKWKKPRRIFVNSMSDIFHEDLPDEIILKIFDTMNKAHWHTFQVLTKRADRMIELSPHINWTSGLGNS
jgi:protein gp37